jgi:hypothetical protein
VIGWNVIVEVERIEQAVLITAVLSHHQEVLPSTTWTASISDSYGKRMTFFNGIGHIQPLAVWVPISLNRTSGTQGE